MFSERIERKEEKEVMLSPVRIILQSYFCPRNRTGALRNLSECNLLSFGDHTVYITEASFTVLPFIRPNDF